MSDRLMIQDKLLKSLTYDHFDGPLSELPAKVEALLEEFGDDVRLAMVDVGSGYEVDFELRLIGNRPETDEEYNARKAREAAKEARRRRRFEQVRAEYERLKAELGE